MGGGALEGTIGHWGGGPGRGLPPLREGRGQRRTRAVLSGSTAPRLPQKARKRAGRGREAEGPRRLRGLTWPPQAARRLLGLENASSVSPSVSARSGRGAR